MKEYIVTEHPGFPYEEPKPQELIRCKDCKHYNGLLYTLCSNSGMNVIDDEEDYCSWAERKAE